MKKMNIGSKSSFMALAATVASVGMAEDVEAAVILNVIDNGTLTLEITEGIYDGVDSDAIISGLAWGDVENGLTASPTNTTIEFTLNGNPEGSFDGFFIEFDSATNEVIGLNIGAAFFADPGEVNGGILTATNFGFPPNTVDDLSELDFSTLSGAALTTGTFTGVSDAITVIPEPSSVALLGLGALGMMVRRRRS